MLRSVSSGVAAVLAVAGLSGSVAAAETRGGSVPTPAPAIVAPAPSPNVAKTPPLPQQPLPVQPVSQRPASPTSAGPIAAPASPVVPPPVEVSSDPRPTFTPGTFVATMAAAERYRAIAEAGGWPNVPNGISALKTGERGPAVPILRRRLVATGDLAPESMGGDVLDEAVLSGVRHFQFRHGLPEAGLVGRRTLAALNVPIETRIRQLDSSAGRLLGSTFPFGQRYVAVNLPSATVEAIEGGSVVRRYVAIVGKTDRPSPTIGAHIQSVNFNPTWTVPTSLIRKDIIPHMRKDPGYVTKMHIRIFDAAGTEVSPATIDWSTEKAVNYLLREDPGPENSLGQVRIDMPNKQAVYMHDTPSKRLFARNTRLNSSGCVRVAGVRDLAAWLLAGTPGPGGPGTTWGQAEIDAAVAAGTRVDVRLTKFVPVIWVYLTGYAMPDGTVHFRDDVYGLDTPAAPQVALPETGPASLPMPVAGPPAPPSDASGQGSPTIDTLVTGALGRRIR